MNASAMSTSEVSVNETASLMEMLDQILTKRGVVDVASYLADGRVRQSMTMFQLKKTIIVIAKNRFNKKLDWNQVSDLFTEFQDAYGTVQLSMSL